MNCKFILLLFVLSVIDFTLQFNRSKSNYNKTYSRTNYNVYKHNYDFIVVGSGPTGSALAVRLSRKGFKVLVIEAGSDYYAKDVQTLGFHLNTTEDKNIAWDYYVKHYPEYTKFRQNVLYPRASGIGGCTLHNNFIHIYPNKEDFDEMIRYTGDFGWSEKNMRIYYNEITGSAPSSDSNLQKRSYRKLHQNLNNQNSNSIPDSVYYNWLPLSYFNIVRVLSLDIKLLDIFNNVLIKPLTQTLIAKKDINGYYDNDKTDLANSHEGNFLVPMNVDRKTFSRKGIYELVENEAKVNPNFDIWTNTFVTKILLDAKNNAIGVSYKKGYHLYQANQDGDYSTYLSTPTQNIYSNLEVIVSAGVFNTPQLMMVSGIGDSNHLLKHGISPKVHLPGVGRNLQDRYETTVNYRFETDFSLIKDCNFEYTDECFKDFTKYHLGAYTFNGILTGSLIKSVPNLKQPDLFILTVPLYFTGYRKGIAKEALLNKNVFTFLILKAHSMNNAGVVKLKSSDPWFKPYINFNYYGKKASQDLYAQIKGIRKARQMGMKFTGNVTELYPGKQYQSDEDLIKYATRTSWGHHACCTMKIGLNTDRMSVLDSHFKVRGTNRLRVADMSMFNKIPGYFPVVYLYMSGYKIADTIAGHYRRNQY